MYKKRVIQFSLFFLLLIFPVFAMSAAEEETAVPMLSLLLFSEIDCHGVRGGDAYIDNCNVCVGGSTGETPCMLPTVLTVDATVVTESTANPGGDVSDDSGAPISSRGICYSTTPEPVSPCVEAGSGTGTFVSSLTGLDSDTLYYIRAFAINSLGAAHGEQSSFTTPLPLSCATILENNPLSPDGFYLIDPDGIGGEASFQVACDMTTEGGGWIDLVRTFNAAGADLNIFRDMFFISNNSFDLTLGLGEEVSTALPGFYLINNATAFNHTEGFHFRPEQLLYTQVRLKYRMQGDDEGYRCTNANWIPLNGPGWEGGYNGYQSPCPSGYSCIQGNASEGTDTPIRAEYENDDINSANTLLTWSGDGGGSAETGNCARDPEIPIANPSTFFTRFLIR